MAETSDEALMEAYARGDGRAFEQLFGRLAPRVYGFFLRCFGDSSIADDLFQTTFMKVHQSRQTYEPGRPVRPWLFTIAARARLDELRRRYRLPEGAGEEELARAAEAQVPRPAPDEELDRLDRAAAVRAVLARLPEGPRVVVCLHYYEGLSFPEIAAALGTTEGAAKLRAFRAYEQLRTHLAPLARKELP